MHIFFDISPMLTAVALGLIGSTSEAKDCPLPVEVRVESSAGQKLRALEVQVELASSTPLNIDARRTNHPIDIPVEIKADRFSLCLPGPDLYKIWVHAPEHRSEAIPIASFGLKGPIQARLTMVPSEPLPGIVPKVVFLSPGHSDAPMKRSGPNKWSLTVPSSSDLEYLLEFNEGKSKLGVPRAAPNPSEPLVAIGRNGFFSIAKSTGGMVKIVYDRAVPPHASIGGSDARAQLQVEGPSPLPELFSLVDQARRNQNELANLWEADASETKTRQIRIGFAKHFFGTLKDASKNATVRQAAGILAAVTSWELSDDEKRLIRTQVGPDSPLWALKPLVQYGNLTTLIGNPSESVEYVEKMSRTAPDRAVRANALAYILKQNLKDRGASSEEQRAQLEKLAEDFSDVPGFAKDLGLQQDPNWSPGESLSWLTLPSVDGQEVKGTAPAHQFTLVEFMADWCIPCRKLAPTLLDIRRAHSDAGLRMVVVRAAYEAKVDTTNDAKDAATDGIIHATVPHSSSLAKKLRVNHYPTLLLLSPNGQVVATDAELLKGDLASNLVRAIHTVDPTWTTDTETPEAARSARRVH